MERSETSPIYRCPPERLMALGGSLILHGVLLCVLALLVFQTPAQGPITTIVSSFSTATTELEPTLETMVPELKTIDADMHAATNKLVTDVVSPQADPELRETFGGSADVVLPGTPIGMTEKVGPSASAGTQVGRDPNGLDDTSESGLASFFGLNVTSSKVVYVVDSSRSMNYPYPGEAKTRFGRVKLELLSTIARLEESDKFFMIFFNEVPLPMPADRLMEATPAVQKRYLTWMTYLKANGTTEPEQALMIALNLNPEVIYFLTDGDFDYRVVPNVTNANRNGVVINTIGFGDDRGEKFMKELAARNSGEYKFIPGGEVPATKSIVSQLKMKTQAQRERTQ